MTAQDERSTDVTLITEQHLFYQSIGGAYGHDAASIQTMQLQLASYHLGGHFSVGCCTGTATAKNNLFINSAQWVIGEINLL